MQDERNGEKQFPRDGYRQQTGTTNLLLVGTLVSEKASFEIFYSQKLIDRLNTQKLSLEFTTYQSNLINYFSLGLDLIPNSSLSAKQDN